uniref:ULP_PROTEASE domain-containing protein n=1 Tax=Steinernema glaseri TaxID=37863 RepID=A0A1I7YE90_9BILA
MTLLPSVGEEDNKRCPSGCIRRTGTVCADAKVLATGQRAVRKIKRAAECRDSLAAGLRKVSNRRSAITRYHERTEAASLCTAREKGRRRRNRSLLQGHTGFGMDLHDWYSSGYSSSSSVGVPSTSLKQLNYYYGEIEDTFEFSALLHDGVNSIAICDYPIDEIEVSSTWKSSQWHRRKEEDNGFSRIRNLRRNRWFSRDYLSKRIFLMHIRKRERRRFSYGRVKQPAREKMIEWAIKCVREYGQKDQRELIDEMETIENEEGESDCESDEERELSSASDSSVSSQTIPSGSEQHGFLQSETGFIDTTTEILKIRFPQMSMSISVADYLCLGEDDHINDTIVDFFINHVIEHELPDKAAARVFAFPTLFWQELRSCSSRNSFSNEGYGKLRKWVQNVDLFDHDFLVIPINEWEHWSVAVVCLPFLVLNPDSLPISDYLSSANANFADLVDQKPFVMIFDSQIIERRSIDDIGDTIKNYLSFEYSSRFKQPLKTSPELFRTVLPTSLPRQRRTNDGGPFMLEFVRRFLHNNPCMSEICRTGTFDFASTYSELSIEHTRDFIQDVILNLSCEKDRWDSLLEGRDAELNNFVDLWY